jgi:hypothetical protein
MRYTKRTVYGVMQSRLRNQAVWLKSQNDTLIRYKDLSCRMRSTVDIQIMVFSRVYYGSIWLKIGNAFQHVVKCSRIEFKKSTLSFSFCSEFQNGTRADYVRFDAFTSVGTKSSILWDIISCNPLKVNRCFGGKCRFHLQGRRIRRTKNQRENPSAFTLLYLYLFLQEPVFVVVAVSWGMCFMLCLCVSYEVLSSALFGSFPYIAFYCRCDYGDVGNLGTAAIYIKCNGRDISS